MDEYPVPSSTQRFELEIKRSKFISTIAHIKNRGDAKILIDRIKNEFPAANHHCWAYVAGAPGDGSQYNQSDDGEPRGTAGKPMLNVLLHSGLGNIVVVVSRYFGGIKLGTGGLARAYTQSVSESLASLKTRQQQITEKLNIAFAYTLQGRIDHYLAAEKIEINTKLFNAEIEYSLSVPACRFNNLRAKLVDLTQGQLSIN